MSEKKGMSAKQKQNQVLLSSFIIRFVSVWSFRFRSVLLTSPLVVLAGAVSLRMPDSALLLSERGIVVSEE